MEEVTEWDGKPRWMWVWDNYKRAIYKEYVVNILSVDEMHQGETIYPVVTVRGCYLHCAEIEGVTRIAYPDESHLLDE